MLESLCQDIEVTFTTALMEGSCVLCSVVATQEILWITAACVEMLLEVPQKIIDHGMMCRPLHLGRTSHDIVWLFTWHKLSSHLERSLHCVKVFWVL